MNSFSETHLLNQLACLYGVQTNYYDVNHHKHQTSEEALLKILHLLGSSVTTLADVPSALREQQQKLWQKILEPITIVWNNEPLKIQIRLPSAIAEETLNGHLILNTGERQSFTWNGSTLPITESAEVNGILYVVKQLTILENIPYGYHKFTMGVAKSLVNTFIISAPERAYLPPDKLKQRMWGVFLPLYALYSKNSYGSGDFSDLESLVNWVAKIGGNVVATLPLLANFNNELFTPSPYAPSSRLLWNEFYLSITNIPELSKCIPAKSLLQFSSFRKELKTLNNLSLVDYKRQMMLKRQILEHLCSFCIKHTPDRLKNLQHFAETHPFAEDYARFQATFERQGISWQSWPEPLRNGTLNEGDYTEEVKDYHLYVQWLVNNQLKDLSETAYKNDILLYLDLPLGVHLNGYDMWRYHNLFATGASAGAPPDTFFAAGQKWGFPPLHPEEIRNQGYQYIIACLRNNMRYAGILRLDHVMSLHRLFWIPDGMDADQGVYVRYKAKELYAILALESWRNKVIIVGEDLGTVPAEVRLNMAKHNIHRMYIINYELNSNPLKAIKQPNINSVASLNTHDMPPFASFWQSLDIKERMASGQLNKANAQLEQHNRQVIIDIIANYLQSEGWIKEFPSNTQDAFRACLSFLSASLSRVVLVNLEDLWLETNPQNIPGIQESYPNWKKKARYSLEVLCQMP
ncbi:MAG: 4-alpha-glucanotransferase, partial [Dehalococcoidales bacterium]|nr:4-alpha-glucanotransferase [Dehalococcoidales bacterium]